jgi:hypothetical protein
MTLEPGTLIGLGGAAAALVTAYVAWRKTGSQTTQLLISASSDVVILQRSTIEDQNKKIVGLERDLEAALLRIRELRKAAEGTGK